MGRVGGVWVFVIRCNAPPVWAVWVNRGGVARLGYTRGRKAGDAKAGDAKAGSGANGGRLEVGGPLTRRCRRPAARAQNHPPTQPPHTTLHMTSRHQMAAAERPPNGNMHNDSNMHCALRTRSPPKRHCGKRELQTHNYIRWHYWFSVSLNEWNFSKIDSDISIEPVPEIHMYVIFNSLRWISKIFGKKLKNV